MLKHEDHIFTNLNGYNSFKLNEAKSRGDWNNTKKIIERGSSWLINEIRLETFNPKDKLKKKSKNVEKFS